MVPSIMPRIYTLAPSSWRQLRFRWSVFSWTRGHLVSDSYTCLQKRFGNVSFQSAFFFCAIWWIFKFHVLLCTKKGIFSKSVGLVWLTIFKVDPYPTCWGSWLKSRWIVRVLHSHAWLGAPSNWMKGAIGWRSDKTLKDKKIVTKKRRISCQLYEFTGG